MSSKRKASNPAVVLLAIIGICALLYGAWELYESRASEDQTYERFAAPVSSGVPDLLHASPAASPLPP